MSEETRRATTAGAGARPRGTSGEVRREPGDSSWKGRERSRSLETPPRRRRGRRARREGSPRAGATHARRHRPEPRAIRRNFFVLHSVFPVSSRAPWRARKPRDRRSRVRGARANRVGSRERHRVRRGRLRSPRVQALAEVARGGALVARPPRTSAPDRRRGDEAVRPDDGAFRGGSEEHRRISQRVGRGEADRRGPVGSHDRGRAEIETPWVPGRSPAPKRLWSP